MIPMKIDILGGTWTKCKCGDPFGTHFACNMGIMDEALCFNCIRLFIYHAQDEQYIEKEIGV